MPYLDPYNEPLSASSAAHLLRRATFGPTPQEISDFTGLTAGEAVRVLLQNVERTISPPPPIALGGTPDEIGKPMLQGPFKLDKTNEYAYYIKYWWIGLMAQQNGYPSLLEKLAAFWQNHFVITQMVVNDYRMIFQYLNLIRSNALGSFRELAIEMSKNPAMLIYQNGNENDKDHPNENYARELQELFTVGQFNYDRMPNYPDSDVRAASRVLTGWRVQNHLKNGSENFGANFTPLLHDTSDKQFSSSYGNKVIKGRSGAQAGDQELNELISMLLGHPECPRFICRKLYRWFVNTEVPRDVEENVIVPLAKLFASPENDFRVAPVLEKLLASDIFYHQENRGSIIKSPAELIIGSMRYFNQAVPDMAAHPEAFRKYGEFIHWRMYPMQLNLIDQPLVFGSLPYYQTGYSTNWINASTTGMRRQFTDQMVYPVEIHPGFKVGIDLVDWISKAQPDFSDVDKTPAITCEQVLDAMSDNLFAHPFFPSQKDFLIDKIMMASGPRQTWIREFNAYRKNPNQDTRFGILWRLEALMKYMLSMAEYQVF